MAYSHTEGRLHAIHSDSPGCVRRRQTCCNEPAFTLMVWRLSNLVGATMDTPAVQAVFDLLYAFRDDMS